MIAFLTIFPGCEPLRESAGGLDKAEVESVVVNEDERSMTVDARFAATAAPAEIGAIESSLRAQFGLLKVTLNAECPKLQPQKQAKSEGVKDGKLLYGRALRKSDVPVDIAGHQRRRRPARSSPERSGCSQCIHAYSGV